MMPSASDLTYFIEVAATANLSRAAERLGISQPSLSLAIQRLEQSVGVGLFIRSKRGVSLTRGGEQLLLRARQLLQNWESVKSSALASTEAVQGRFTLGCHPALGLYSLPLFLPEMLESYPALELRLTHDLSRRVVEGVISMKIDLGIVVNPIKHPDLVIRKLCDDEVTFWVGAGQRKTQNLASGEAVLICDPELLQTQDLLKKLKRNGLEFRRILATPSLELVTQLTASGAGVGIIPSRVAAVAGHRGLRRVAGAPVYQDEVCLLYRVENRNVRSIQVISDRVVSGFKDSPASVNAAARRRGRSDPGPGRAEAWPSVRECAAEVPRESRSGRS